MSTALAIASVTAVLQDLLNNGLIDQNVSAGLGNVPVTALPPDRVEASEPIQQSQLNLFLYRVTFNQGWRNVGLPSRGARGERISDPPLALDLHYLLTAYGASDLHAEILLGYAMHLLHETPVLSREALRRALGPNAPVSGAGLLPQPFDQLVPELAEQAELIKITPETFSTEDMSRLWTAFQAKYRPTVAYTVSVVLIESRRPFRTPLPVLARRLYVRPLRRPVIHRVLSRATAGDPVSADRPILPGDLLVLVGERLRGDPTTEVDVGGVSVTPPGADVTDDVITVAIPAGVQAGVRGVQVVHPLLLGSPPTPHGAIESNAGAFVLRPRLGPIAVANVQGSGSAPRSGTITVAVEPPIGPGQRVQLVLDPLPADQSPPAPPTTGYTFLAPPGAASPPGGSVTVPFREVVAGSYLVRLQVDGAQSPLGLDAGGRFDSPRVTIP